MGHKNLHNTDVAGYVEVADEPLHKEVYADRYFRAYLATLTPGQATCYHRHSEDTLYFVIKGGRMSTTNLKGYKRSPIVFPQSFRMTNAQDNTKKERPTTLSSLFIFHLNYLRLPTGFLDLH